MTFSVMLDFEFSVLILFSYLYQKLQIRSRNSFLRTSRWIWMIDQNSISEAVQGVYSLVVRRCGGDTHLI